MSDKWQPTDEDLAYFARKRRQYDGQPREEEEAALAREKERKRREREQQEGGAE